MDFVVDVDAGGPTVPSSAMLLDDEPDILLAGHFIAPNPINAGLLLHVPSLGLEAMALNTTLPRRPQLLQGHGHLESPKRLSNGLFPEHMADRTQLSSLITPDLMMIDQPDLLHPTSLDVASLTPLQQSTETNLPANFTTLSLYPNSNIVAISKLGLSASMGLSTAAMPQLPPVASGQDGASTPNPRKPGYNRPSREDWIKYKPEIRKLYLEEKSTLSEVMDIMREKYNFNATVKMYKSRFGEWGYVKNNRESDIRAMIKVKKRCEAMGKRPEFSVSGLQYDSKRLETYLRRKKKTERSILGFHGTEDERLASYITYHMASMGPSTLRSPDNYHRLEAVMTASGSHIDLCFGPDKLSPLDKDTMNTTGWRLEQFDEAVFCYNLLASGDFKRGGRVFRKIALRFEEMLRIPGPFVLMETLTVVAFLSEWPELVSTLIQGAVHLSQEYIRSSRHPVRVFLAQLVSCDGAELSSTVATALTYYMDALARIFGEASYLIVKLCSHFSDSLGCSALAVRSLRGAEITLKQREDKFGINHEYTLHYLYRVACLERDNAELVGTGIGTAKRRFEQLLERAGDSGQKWWLKHASQSALAFIHEDWFDDLDTAERYRRSAISTFQQHNATPVECGIEYLCLQELLQDQGKHEEANEISQLLEDMFPPDDEEMVLSVTSSADATDKP